jgi:predicted anti-sigma-YlaC factor YlaD
MSTSSCERVRRWAALAPDGVLSELETWRLARHLETCPHCRDFGSTVQALTDEIRSTPPEQPPESWTASAAPRARARHRLPAGRQVAQRGAVLATFLAGIAIGTVGLPGLADRHAESSVPRGLVIVASGDEDTGALLKGTKEAAYAPRSTAAGLQLEAQHPGLRAG